MVEKRYKILESLPAYGPMHINVSQKPDRFFSAGFAIRFYRSDETEWVANFEPGWTNLNEVHELPDNNIVVIAGGTCYIMNCDEEKPKAVFGGGCVKTFETKDGRCVLQEQEGIRIVESDGTYWKSPTIFFDGFKELKLEENIISGLVLGPDDEWLPFTLDIDTKVLNGGIFIQKSKKPWWKLW